MSLVPVDDAGGSHAEPPPERLARVFAPRGTRLHFAWGVGPQIRVCPVGAPPEPSVGAGGGGGGNGAPAPSPPAPPPLLSYGGGGNASPQARDQRAPAPGPCVLTTVAWSSPSMEQRRVAYDVLPLYRQIRRVLRSLEGSAAPSDPTGRAAQPLPPPTGALAVRRRDALCAYARAVRRVLESARVEAPPVSVGLGGDGGGGGDGSAPVPPPPPPPPPPPSADALQTLYEASAWHLLELLCLDPSTSSEGFFAEAFAAWFARHGPLLSTRPGAGWDPLLAARRRLAAAPRPDADPSFWPLAARLAALGRLGEAAGVLLSHPAYRAPGQHAATLARLERVYALLRQAPRLVAPASPGGGGGGGGGRGGASSSPPVVDLGRAMDDPASFRRERAEWQAEAAAMARREPALGGGSGGGDPEAEEGLRELLSVCSGDEGALRRAAGRNWLEFLVALLVWRYPDLRPRLHLRQLVAHAQAAVGGGGGGKGGGGGGGRGGSPDGEDGDDGGGGGGPADAGLLAFFDDLIAAAAELEVQSVVAVCTNSPYCGLWFVAHCYDLLCADPQAARALARPLPAPLACGQAEAYMLHYVDTLAGQASTWQLAAEYLAWCPAHGADALEALLERLPFPLAGPGGGGAGGGAGGGGGNDGGQGDDDGRAAHKALALCARHGLSGAAAALCRRLGARCAELGARGAALRWLLRAHDARGVAALAAPLLEAVRRALCARAAECAGGGGYAVRPLPLPELEELAPVLDACLAAGGPAEVALSRGGGGGFSGGDGGGGGGPDAGAAAPSAGALAVAASTRPYPELQFLRCFVRLQRAAHAAQQAQAAADARAAEAAAAAERAADAAAAAGGGGAGGEAAAAEAVAAADAAGRRLAAAEAHLCAAQGAVRAPLLELALGGLAPASPGARAAPALLPLLLLAFGVPLLESPFSPLSADDVGRLLAAGRRAAAGAGGAGAGAGGLRAPSGGVADLQLALTRALARAHVEAGAAPAAALVAAN